MEKNKKTIFQDEFIVKKRREMEKKNYMSVHSGFYAGEEFVTFSEMALFSGNMTLYLPDAFIDMPEEYSRVIYPSENCPEILKSGLKGDIVFSFQLVDQRLDMSELEYSMEQFRQMLKKSQPLNFFFENGIINENGVSIAWMDYKGYGIDQSLYQLLYILTIKEDMMLGMFHCPFYKAESWKPIVRAVLKTIKIKGV